METVRQLTSGLPWISAFHPSIEAKFEELNRSLDVPPRDEVDTVCLTREAVEGIAFSPETPEEIAANFIEVIQKADKLLSEGVPPFQIFYVLNVRGLKLVSNAR